MLGRTPKPTHLKILEGNPGKRPLNLDEPKPRPVTPTCPSWLTGEAKREWKRLVPELEALGLLTIVDRGALAVCCQSYGRMVEAEKFLQRAAKTGFMFKTPSGYLQQLPQVSIAQKYAQQYRSFLGLFGLSPADRTRLSTGDSADEADEMEQLLRQRSGGR